MIILGTELKINVAAEPINGFHMDDYDFTCTFFTSKNNKLVLSKTQMKRVDNDNYIAMIDTSQIGVGALRLRFEADIPDDDFEDHFRKEISLIDLKIQIGL